MCGFSYGRIKHSVAGRMFILNMYLFIYHPTHRLFRPISFTCFIRSKTAPCITGWFFFIAFFSSVYLTSPFFFFTIRTKRSKTLPRHYHCDGKTPRGRVVFFFFVLLFPLDVSSETNRNFDSVSRSRNRAERFQNTTLKRMFFGNEDTRFKPCGSPPPSSFVRHTLNLKLINKENDRPQLEFTIKH